MSATRVLLLGAAVLTLAGCSGMSEQACVTTDWRAMGFEHGAHGQPAASGTGFQQACGAHGTTVAVESYRAGYAEGVRGYCQVNNAFALGRSGATYQGVCPADVAEPFVAEYNAGRRLSTLESAVRNVDARIASSHREQENVRQELGSIELQMAAATTTREQRLSLAARSAELGRRDGDITSQIEQFGRDRVVAERALRAQEQRVASTF